MFAKFVKVARVSAALAVLIGSLALAGCSVSVDAYPYHHHYYRGHYYYYD
jgi:outer membrane protein assembly factor BamE (lipoprotein component of BamABCDE complex)